MDNRLGLTILKIKKMTENIKLVLFIIILLVLFILNLIVYIKSTDSYKHKAINLLAMIICGIALILNSYILIFVNN